ncbi:MAG: alkaline shock response membrane anchor protein AmaP [Actinomycetota bacterium]
MNIFNRIIVVILLLFLVVFSIVSFVNMFANLYNISDIADRIVNYVASANQFILALVLLLIVIVGLVILVFEFYRRKPKAANISKDQSGKTMITLKTVSKQIREKLLPLENVIDPKVKVIPKKEGIMINIYSNLVKGDNVADRTQEIRRAASDFASKELGFRVLKTNYTATGFITRKEEKEKEEEEKEVEIKETPEEEKQEKPDTGEE